MPPLNPVTKRRLTAFDSDTHAFTRSLPAALRLAALRNHPTRQLCERANAQPWGLPSLSLGSTHTCVPRCARAALLGLPPLVPPPPLQPGGRRRRLPGDRACRSPSLPPLLLFYCAGSASALAGPSHSAGLLRRLAAPARLGRLLLPHRRRQRWRRRRRQPRGWPSRCVRPSARCDTLPPTACLLHILLRPCPFIWLSGCFHSMRHSPVDHSLPTLPRPPCS